MITTDDRIITAVHVDNGAYVDGKVFDELLELTKKKEKLITKLWLKNNRFHKLLRK